MPQKILIVEDEPTLCSILEKKLAKKFEVLVAKNGREGLKEALSWRPDIILLDIIMPIMDGMTMLSKLREDAWGKDVPVILLTNLVDSEKVFEAQRKGVYDYLIKSDWRLEDVVAKVHERLKA